MSEAVVIAIITGVLAVAGSYVGNLTITRRKSAEDAVRDAQREARQQLRLENIEHKLDVHNGYAEKLGAVEQSIAAIERDIEYLRKGVNYDKSK